MAILLNILDIAISFAKQFYVMRKHSKYAQTVAQRQTLYLKLNINFYNQSMTLAIFAFLIGTLCLQLCSKLPNIFAVTIGLFIVTISWYCFRKKRTNIFFKILTIAYIGFLWTLIHAYIIDSHSLTTYMEGKNLVVIGHVISLPEIQPQFTKLIIDTLYVNHKKQKIRASINWYGEYPQVNIDDTWQLLIRLKRPHGTFNQGGFDFEKNLFQKGINATGYVVSSNLNRRINTDKHFCSINCIRQLLQKKIMHSLNDYKLKGLITTLVIGDQSGISKDQWKIFRDTGTSYLMAISGLHINFVALIVFILFNFLWRNFSKLTLLIPSRCAATTVSLFAAYVYSIISGLSIPTKRALIMLAIANTALILRRNVRSQDVLLFTLAIILLINPLSVLSEGFWLSFVAVALIIFANNCRLNINKSWWLSYCRIQWCITLGLTPFTLLFFHQASFISLFASALALPAVCFIVIPISLIGSITLTASMHYGGHILWLAEKIMEFVWIFLQWLASFSKINWLHFLPNWWIFTSSLIGSILLLAPRGFNCKKIGIIWLLPLFLYKPQKPEYGEIWFTLLDVGQGLSSVIRTKNHVIIYDAGPTSITSDAGETVAIPFLLSIESTDVDALIISHGDDDHIGGTQSIISQTRVQKILTSVPEKFFYFKNVNTCSSEQNWNWDGVSFSFINQNNKSFSKNNSSCVLKIDNGTNSILLPGDIERMAENWLLDNKFSSLNSTILVVPHHGSKTSSNPKFVAAINPKYALFSVGYRNRFRLPSKCIVKRYQQQQSKTFKTSSLGAITFKLKKNRIFDELPICHRITNGHYWNFKGDFKN